VDSILRMDDRGEKGRQRFHISHPHGDSPNEEFGTNESNVLRGTLLGHIYTLGFHMAHFDGVAHTENPTKYPSSKKVM